MTDVDPNKDTQQTMLHKSVKDEATPVKRSHAAISPGRLTEIRGGLIVLFVLSCLVNLLALTGPIFMMQIYDRVLPSGAVSTLVGMALITLLLYLALGAFDTFRQQIATLRSEELAERLSESAFLASLGEGVTQKETDAGIKQAAFSAPEDVETLRSYLSSPALLAWFDLPAMPVFLILVALLHPVLGVVVLLAGLLLGALALINERLTRKRFAEARESQFASQRLLQDSRRDADSVSANAMSRALAFRWLNLQEKSRRDQLQGTRINSVLTSITKTLRMAIQSAVLGIGAWLAIQQEISPGAMIAASIIFARALAPLEQTLTGFKQFLRAREAWSRIKLWAEKDNGPQQSAPTELPAPRNTFGAEDLEIFPTGAIADPKPLLKNVSFVLNAGECLAVLGPSGAGKSTLARAIAGARAPDSGRVLLDGADLYLWPQERRGQHIGYLSQDVTMFGGSVAQNISRFSTTAKDEDIVAAAKSARVHELILGLPQGYDTVIGQGGLRLSGGQVQRIGLARALYLDPFVVVLDEPNAHLDMPSEMALVDAIRQRNANGKLTILISHGPALTSCAQKIMVIEAGIMKTFGPRDQILSQLRSASEQARSKTGQNALKTGANT